MGRNDMTPALENSLKFPELGRLVLLDEGCIDRRDEFFRGPEILYVDSNFQTWYQVSRGNVSQLSVSAVRQIRSWILPMGRPSDVAGPRRSYRDGFLGPPMLDIREIPLGRD